MRFKRSIVLFTGLDGKVHLLGSSTGCCRLLAGKIVGGSAVDPRDSVYCCQFKVHWSTHRPRSSLGCRTGPRTRTRLPS